MIATTKKLYLAVTLALAAMMLAATVAVAAVTFDPGTGKGFVGKGDLQVPWGWNNSQLQQNASGVSFTYNTVDEYDVTIEFETGNPAQPKSLKTHTVTQEKSTAVDKTVAYDLRVKNQITGFNLNGFGATNVSGDPIPSVGDECPNGNLGCEVIAVEKTSSSGGLYAHHSSKNSLLLQ